MAKIKYQKTLVRYAKNDRPAFEGDEWYEPSYLGITSNGEVGWYGYTFEDLVAEKKVHKIWCSDSYANTFDENDWSPEAVQARQNAQRSMFEHFQQFTSVLMANGLLPRFVDNPWRAGEKIEYKYVVEGYRFEHYTIKEILGLEKESFQDLTEEEFKQIREKLDPTIWDKFNALYETNNFIDLSGLSR